MLPRRDFLRTATLAMGAAALPEGASLSAAVAASQPAEPRAAIARVPVERPLRIGAVIFPRMDQIDLTGPFAVLSRIPNASIQLLWKERGPVKDHKGLSLAPDATLEEAGALDLLVVPGGPGQEALMEDQVLLSFLAQQAERVPCVFSVCTGALLCGAAGLLRGRTATTHWASVHLLKYFGATPSEKRVVVDGKLVSAAGLTAGIDGALMVAALLRGEDAAKAIQLDIQYAPEPPYDCGLPQRAPAEILSRVTGSYQKLSDQRMVTARRAAARLKVPVTD